jgi:ATP-dependent DNA helicase RecQ
VEAAAALLESAGVHAAVYHAGLKDEQRVLVQDAFAAGSLPVVCATNAFGMGIDRPDLEAVVHYAIPGSIEAYYQEIGRAGRDGRSATATLLWDEADVATRQYLIDSPRRDRTSTTSAGAEPAAALRNEAEIARRKAVEHRKLERMIEYADTAGCLRATILRYFGDAAAAEGCTACGNCRPGALDAYERELVRKILAGIARAGERYGRHRIAAMLLGTAGELPPALTKLSTFGLLRHETADTLRDWIRAAVAGGLIAVSDDDYRILSLTDRGREFMYGRLPTLTIDRPSSFWSAVPHRHRRERFRPLKAYSVWSGRGLRSRR